MSLVHSNSVVPVRQRPLKAASEVDLAQTALSSNRLIPEKPRSVQFLSTIRFQPLTTFCPPAALNRTIGDISRNILATERFTRESAEIYTGIG
jgi:hypothetical protein